MIKSLYFSHDYTSSDDVKMLYLRQALGMEAVGIFWYVVEKLAQAGGRLPLKIIPVLAMQMQVTEPKVTAVITGYELFEIHNEQFSSHRLTSSLALMDKLKEAGKKGAAIRWGITSEQTKIILK